MKIFIDFLLGRSAFLNFNFGPIAGALVGAAGSYLGARRAAKGQEAAARTAADAAKFRPYNMQSGFGSATFYDDPGNRRAVGMLSPQYQALRDQFMTQAQGLSPRYQQLQDYYLDRSMLSDRDQALADQMRTQAEGFSNALTNYDPEAAAGDIYSKIAELNQPYRQQQQLDLENRLLAQGMLGSTGGASRFQAQQAAFGEQDLRGQLAAREMAQSEQAELQRLAASGLATARELEADPMRFLQTGMSFDNIPLSYLQAAIGLDQLPQQLIDRGGVLGGRSAMAGANAGSYLANAIGGRDLAMGNLYGEVGRGLGDAIGGMFKRNQTNTPVSGNKDGGTYSPYDRFADELYVTPRDR